MNKKAQTDVRELPSWSYMGWGILNGLFLSISVKFGLDISDTGIASQILNSFKPLLQSVNQSTHWITAIVVLFGFIGTLSTVFEIISIYQKGGIPRIIAFCGFVSIFLIVINFWINFAVFLIILGALLVGFFPDK